MLHSVLVITIILVTSVSSDLGDLLRFADGGPPPPPPSVRGRQESSSIEQHQNPSSPPPSLPPPQRSFFKPIHDHSSKAVFPEVKHVFLPTHRPTLSALLTPSPPAHSRLLKSAQSELSDNSAHRNVEIESKLGLVRIDKLRINTKHQSSTPTPAPPPSTTPAPSPSTPAPPPSTPASPPSTPAPPPSTPAPPPSTPAPHQSQTFVALSSPAPQLQGESLVRDTPPELKLNNLEKTDDDEELETAVRMLRTNWDFIKRGGRLVLSTFEEDPIVISKASFYGE